jgi:hypothetical protein
MDTTATTTPPQTAPGIGLLRSRTQIAAARTRAEQPSDGGSTGRSDSND